MTLSNVILMLVMSTQYLTQRLEKSGNINQNFLLPAFRSSVWS